MKNENTVVSIQFENVDSILKKDGWVMSGSGYWHLHYVKGMNTLGSAGYITHCTSDRCFLTMNISA